MSAAVAESAAFVAELAEDCADLAAFVSLTFAFDADVDASVAELLAVEAAVLA